MPARLMPWNCRQAARLGIVLHTDFHFLVDGYDRCFFPLQKKAGSFPSRVNRGAGKRGCEETSIATPTAVT